MKSWLIFGSGLFLGVFLGAFVASFFLFDDMTTAPPVSHRPVVAKAKPSHRKIQPAAAPQTLPEPQSVALVPESRPAAVAAEAVDPDTLPPAEDSGVTATARTDTAPVTRSP